MTEKPKLPGHMGCLESQGCREGGGACSGPSGCPQRPKHCSVALFAAAQGGSTPIQKSIFPTFMGLRERLLLADGCISFSMEACSCTVSSDRQELLRVDCSHRSAGWAVSKPLTSYFYGSCSIDSDNLKSYNSHIELEGWRDGSAVRSTCYTAVRIAVCVPAPHTKVGLLCLPGKPSF